MRIVAGVRKRLGDEYVPFLAKYDSQQQLTNETTITTNNDFLEQWQQLSQLETKEEIRFKMLTIFRKVGYNKFMKEAYNLRDVTFPKNKSLKGEVAEVILEVILDNYITTHNLKDWACYKSFIINLGNYTTELDFVLVTSVCITVIEIKSYAGDKKLTNICTISRKRNSFDVFEQNRKHIKSFHKKYNKFAKASNGIYKSVLFSFSTGALDDERITEYQLIMPVYTIENIIDYLDILRLTEVQPRWDYPRLMKQLEHDYQNSPTMEDHLAFINRLKGKK